jgi:glyoxylase-like metal-dependent hydrolase (beta-lactamase superfamily II)/ferredoxin
MANWNKRVKENIPGEFFVDTTCIDCDTCRQIAPEVFSDAGEYSYVTHQPQTPIENKEALHALLSCPTGSIGTLHPNQAAQAISDFPLNIEEDVYYCGFNSPKSYGGNSYFIQHPDGNWLIDSPKFLPPLIKQFERLGGISTIFLTHEDDIADTDKYAEHFQSRCIIHKADQAAIKHPGLIIEGIDPVSPHPDFTIIPTPGHTRGHCVLLYKNKYLFTGDHLWWNRDSQQLGASKSYCWYSWAEQTASMARLLDYHFEWVLPGHGQRIHLDADTMHHTLETLVNRMKKA